MRKKLSKIVFAILVLLPVYAYSVDITFTSSGTITDGNIFDNVYVQNDGTVINMSGGQINNSLWTSDDSIFNMSGGLIFGAVTIAPISTFNVSDDGTIDIFDFVVDAGASVNISGGNITADRLKTYPGASNPVTPASVVNINGGNIGFELFDILGGEINIYRGLLNVNACNIHLYPYKGASINIYGNDFNYTPMTGILTGYLLDNNFFTIKGVSPSEYARFNLIPEPISLLLFGFGLLAIRKHKKGV